MAVIGAMALSVTARTERLKQDLKPALDAIKDWGKAAEAAGMSTVEVNREMGRMRAEAARGPKAAAEATDGLRQKLNAAKQGAAALSGAISAVSSEAGGAVGHFTRLGSSLTSSFLAGGPIALGVTALAAGMSALTGRTREAAEEAEKAEKAYKAFLEKARERVEVLKAENDAAARRSAFGGNDAAASRYEAEREITREIERQRAAILAGGETLNGLLARRVALEEMISRTNGVQREAAQDALARLNVEIQKKSTAIDLEDAALQELLKKQERLKDAAKAEADERERSAKAAKEQAAAKTEVEGRKSLSAENAEARKGVEALRKEEDEAQRKILGNYDAREKRRAEAERKEFNQRMADTYGMEAQNEENRVRAKQATAAAAKAAAEKDAAKAAKDAAEAGKAAAAAAKEKAKAEREATEALRAQSRLVSQRPDITKRFGNVGGSMFGFGAGQAGTGMGDIGGDAARAARGAGPWSRNGGAAQAQGATVKPLELPDVSAQIKALEAEIAKIPPWYEKLAGAVTSAAGATKGAVTDLGRATERAVGNLRSSQDALKAEVRSLAKAIERAGGGTGAGD